MLAAAPELAQGVRDAEIGPDFEGLPDRIHQHDQALLRIEMEEIFRVQDADDLVEVAVVDRETRVARALQEFENHLRVGALVDGQDLFPRNHHVAHLRPRHTEDVAQDLSRIGSDLSGIPSLDHQQQELLGGMDREVLAGGPHTEQAHQPVAGTVHEHQYRTEDAPEDQQGPCAPQRNLPRPVEGQRLGRELTDDDVEEGDDGEGNHHGGRVHGDRRTQSDAGEDRGDQPGDAGFAHEAETDAGQGDPELSGCDGVIQVLDGDGRGPGATAPFIDPELDLGAPDGHQGELRRHEVRVGEDQDCNNEKTEQGKS